MKDFRLEREQIVPMPIGEVFAFFSDPANLEELTPPWLHFRIVACSSDSIAEGTEIDYKLRVRGVPIRWRSLISAFQPPHQFVDEQVRGPYRRWIHTHTFEELAGGTRVRDEVRYAVPGGALVNRLFVGPDLDKIFQYRQERLLELLEHGVAQH